MAKWRNMQFRTKLFFVFLLLSGIPSLFIGITAYRKSVELYRLQTEQDLNVILGQLTTSIERQIFDFDRFTMLPYYLPDIFQFLNEPQLSSAQWSSKDIEAQRTMVRLMSAYPSINNSIMGLMIYGMNGSINGYRTHGDLLINPEANAKAEDWYKRVIEEGGGFVLTGVRSVDQFTGEPLRAVIGSRMLRDGDFRPLAVIAIYISPDFIPKIVSSLELPNVNVTVMDAEREVIYASDLRLAERIPASLPEGRRSWEAEAEGKDGARTFFGVSTESEYLGWSVHMGVDRDHMLRGSRPIRNYTLVVVSVVSVLAAVVSWLLARGLSKPIQRLIVSMREVERGKFLVPEPHEGGGEIGLLEISYRRMVQRLEDQMHAIEEKERQKREAEIYALKARIQPHFLNNTLNSIRMLAIVQRSERIAGLIHSLNKLLRANMRMENETIPLDDEMKLLAEYADIMSLRYENVFVIDWDVHENTREAAVPPMLLQPLLENAIFHGAKGLQRKLRIEVTAKREGKLLVLAIQDDGIGFGGDRLDIAEGSKARHIGLQNVNDRIRLRYGEGYGLTVSRIAGKSVAAVRMPYVEVEG